jgi:hypothetical protein
MLDFIYIEHDIYCNCIHQKNFKLHKCKAQACGPGQAHALGTFKKKNLRGEQQVVSPLMIWKK